MTKTQTATKIPVLSADPSKEEEIKFFQAIQCAAPADSYLAGLLSGDDILNWVTLNIRNDFSIDLMAEYRAASNKNDELRAVLMTREAEVATLTRQNADLKAALQKEQVEKIHLNNAYEQLATRADDATEKLITVNNARVALEGQFNGAKDCIASRDKKIAVLTELVYGFSSDREEERAQAEMLFDKVMALAGAI